MESEVSVPRLQEPTTSLFAEPDESMHFQTFPIKTF